jgi:hypothetical protein
MGTATELPEWPPAPAAESEAIISIKGLTKSFGAHTQRRGPGDPCRGSDRPPPASVPDEQALDAIRDTSDRDEDSGIVDDVLLILAVAFFGGGALYLLWSHRHADHTIAD